MSNINHTMVDSIDVDEGVEAILDEISKRIVDCGNKSKTAHSVYMGLVNDLKNHARSSNDISKTYAMTKLGDDFDENLMYIYNPKSKKICVYDRVDKNEKV